MAEETTKKKGNIGLPFGLCKKYGVTVPDGATPRDAWDALKGKTGLSPKEVYMRLRAKQSMKDDEKKLSTRAGSAEKKKKSLSDYYKERKEKDRQFFYGETTKASNKYFRFKHYKDDYNVVVVTNNIKFIKGNPVLVVGNNKAVYLKDWQYRPVMNWENDINAYAVKLNRNYFKPYTFRFNFDEFGFEKEETFDDYVKVAKEQDEENMRIAEA